MFNQLSLFFRLQNNRAAGLLRRMKLRRGRVPDPIPKQEQAFRGSSDPMTVIDRLLQNNFPGEIQDWLDEVDEETRNEMIELFTEEVPNIEKCGEFIYKCEDYYELRGKVEELGTTKEKETFIDLFFDLGMFEQES